MTTIQRASEMTKLVWWPTPQDYNEAVQNPATTFSDPTLQNSEILVGSLGLPRPVCGAFASVYRVRSAETEYAVRCFLRNVSDQESRYQLISDFVQSDSLPYTVGFDFQSSGMKIRNDSFPVLKMDWVHGQTLEQFVAANLSNSAVLQDLAAKFLNMCDDLRDAGIAHGDLQHGNILVTGSGELRLVDYDGMYVPAMDGMKSNELGHRNYQHPERTASHFGPYLDNFAAWVIYASLRILAIDSSLFFRLGGGDESLLFKKSDFVNPLRSKRFAVLEAHSSEEIRNLARIVRANIGFVPEYVPKVSSALHLVHLEPLAARTSETAGTASGSVGLPDWLRNEIEAKSKLPDWMIQEEGHFVKPVSGASRTTPVGYAVEAELLKPVPRLTVSGKPQPYSNTRSITTWHQNPNLSSNAGAPRDISVAEFCVILGLLGSLCFGPRTFLVVAVSIIVNFLVRNAIRRSRDNALVTNGEVAKAEVTYIGAASFNYRFYTLSGELIPVERTNVDRATMEFIETAGRELTVLYDPTDAKGKHIFYAQSLVRAV